jgi:hypothetical protein
MKFLSGKGGYVDSRERPFPHYLSELPLHKS